MELENTYKVLQEFSDAAEVLYREKLIDGDVIASGELLNSVRANANYSSGKFTVVMNLDEYWKYIEYGRSPGKFPPPEAILKWIEAKPILPTPDANGRIPTEKQLSFLIGRKIARSGISPRPYLGDTIEEVYSEFIDRITEAFALDVQKESFSIITAGLNQQFKNIQIV